MSVADILQQMAENAGRSRASRGALIGNTIENLASLPGQIANEHERQAIFNEQRARQRAADQRGANQDARQTANDARDEAARVAQKQYDDVVNAGLAAGMGASGNPQGPLDAPAALAEVTKRGVPTAIRDVIKIHREMAQKYSSGAPGSFMRDENQQVVPGSGIPEKPPAPSLAGFANDLNSPDPTVVQRAQTALDALKPPAAQKSVRSESFLLDGKAVKGVFDPTAGTYLYNGQDVTARVKPIPPASAAAADPFGGMSSADILTKLSPDQKAQAQALVDGRRSLDPRLASKPYGQAIISAAYAIDPTFDQGNYNARNKARTDLTSPNGTGGKTIGALNTAIQHAGKLSDLIEKLDNYESPLANAVVNPVRTAFGSTKVTNYDTVAPQLAKEIERVWRGAGGTAGEIHDLIETIGHNKGKQQQREALQQFVELAKGKLDTQEQQRDTVLGPAGKSIPILYEKNKAIIDTIAQRAGGKPASTTAAPAEGQAGTVNGVPAVWKTVNGVPGWYAR